MSDPSPSPQPEVLDTRLRVSIDVEKKQLVASRGKESFTFDGCGGRAGLLRSLGPPTVTKGPKDNPMLEALDAEAWVYESRDAETEEGLVFLLTASSGKIGDIGIGTQVYEGSPSTREEAERLFGPCSSQRATYLHLPAIGWIACERLRNIAFRTSTDMMEYKDSDGVPRNDYAISMAMIKHAGEFCPPKPAATKGPTGTK